MLCIFPIRALAAVESWREASFCLPDHAYLIQGTQHDLKIFLVMQFGECQALPGLSLHQSSAGICVLEAHHQVGYAVTAVVWFEECRSSSWPALHGFRYDQQALILLVPSYYKVDQRLFVSS